MTPAAACSHEADRIDIHCPPDHRGIYPSSSVLQFSNLRLQYLRRCLQAGDIKLTKFLTILPINIFFVDQCPNFSCKDCAHSNTCICNSFLNCESSKRSTLSKLCEYIDVSMSKLENSSIYPSFMRGRAGEWWSVANLLLLQPGNTRHHTPSDGCRYLSSCTCSLL